MDATLNIVVRVAARQAQQQLAATQAAVQSVGKTAPGLKRLGAQFANIAHQAGRLNTALTKAAKANRNFAAAISNSKLIKHGKNLNWVGRQLIYNFTLPLALAGAALFKFNKDIEESMVQVRKVYGDLSMDQAQVRAETDALSRSFELLSTRFGIHQKEVIDIAAAWASAGSAGRGLAENVKMTLQVMILGEMEAAEATEALIAMQAQWRLSTYDAAGGVSELTEAIAVLNIVENEVAVNMEALIVAFSRSSGIARSAGVTIRELAAMVAALVPAAGNATEAGNSLKTIISRMVAPTRMMTDTLVEMGIAIDSDAWKNSTATEKLQEIADTYEGLSESQQAYASSVMDNDPLPALTAGQKAYSSSVLAGRRQVSRFGILMQEMGKEQSFYKKALDASADSQQNLAVLQQELTTVLESSPRKWDIMTNAIRNSMAKAFIPLMPAIMSLMQLFAQLADAFSDLDPSTQKLILYGLVIVAIVGPILSLIGSTMQLIGVFGSFARVVASNVYLVVVPALRFLGMTIKFVLAMAIKAMSIFLKAFVTKFIPILMRGLAAMASGVVAALGAMTAPMWIAVGVLVAVAAAIILILKTDIEEPFVRVFNNIVKQLGKLPRIFADIFRAVFQVLVKAVEGIVELLSYLNPFARHSPSLVDNVRAGVGVILDEYAKLKVIPGIVARALAAFSGFQVASGGDMVNFRTAELDSMVSDVTAQNPTAGAAASVMATSILELEATLGPLSREIAAQGIVVARLSDAFDSATASVEAAEASLASIQSEMSDVTAGIAAAQNEISNLSQAPIDGMEAMSDAIFANRMEQNKLNLELMEFERLGYTIDSIREKYAALNGDIELLGGERASLRMAGAGSDILDVYDDQIAALEDQKGGLAGIQDEIQEIQDELDELDFESRFLELTQSITFDPLLREIDKLVNGVEEMSFDEIVAGINEQQGIIATLEASYAVLAAAELAAQDALTGANAERDQIGAQLDDEAAKLDALKQAYFDIEDLIQSMESAMKEYSTAAATAAREAAADGASAFDDAGDFEIPGGTSVLGAEGDLFDIEQFNKDLDAELQALLEDMDDLDLFEGLEDSLAKLEAWKNKAIAIWEAIPQWFRDNWSKLLVAAVVAALALAFGPAGILGVALAAALAGLAFILMEYAGPIWGWIDEHVVQPIVNAMMTLWGWLEPIITTVIDSIVLVVSTLWGWLEPIFTLMIEAIRLAHEPLLLIWDAIKLSIEVAWEVIKVIWDAIVFYLMDIVIPAYQALADIAVWAWEKVIEPAISTAWDLIKIVFKAIRQFIDNFLIPIFTLFATVAEIVFALVKLHADLLWRALKKFFGFIKGYANTLLIEPIQKAGLLIGIVWDEMQVGLDLLEIAFRVVFDTIKGIVDKAWDYLKVLFNMFGSMLDPIRGALQAAYGVVKAVLGAIAGAFATAWNGITSIVAGALNILATGFNFIADGVNSIAGLLGVDSRVTSMPTNLTGDSFKIGVDFSEFDAIVGGLGNLGGDNNGGGGAALRMASGGVIGREGGAVAGARALVGEGSNVFPEYVIPTDRKYRNRALGLYSELGHTFGLDGEGRSNMDLFGLGGAISSGFGAAKDGLGKIGGMLKDGAIAAIWNPLKWLATQTLNTIPNDFIKNAGLGMLGGVDGWIKGADNAWNEEALRRIPTPASGAGSWKVIPEMLASMGVPHKILSTFRPGAITRFTGRPSWHGKDRAIDLSGPSGMVNYSPSALKKINHAIYDAYKPNLKEMIYGGPGAKNVLGGRDHRFSNDLMGEHINHVHAALARGGFVVPRSNGGSLFRIGEGLNDEAVQVMPLHSGGSDASGVGETVNNFYGDLSFPNITDPDDAGRFIENLEALGAN